jgi:hypothetical protein
MCSLLLNNKLLLNNNINARLYGRYVPLPGTIEASNKRKKIKKAEGKRRRCNHILFS